MTLGTLLNLSGSWFPSVSDMIGEDGFKSCHMTAKETPESTGTIRFYSICKGFIE